MILVIECDLKEIRLSSFNLKQGKLVSGFIKKQVQDIWDEKGFKRAIRELSGKHRIKAVSFRLFFGGDYFKKPAIIDDKFFSEFNRLTDFFPFYVPAISKILNQMKNIFKGILMIAFFETSFFTDLPDDEKYYALPAEYHRNNKIKKWGFHGIFHKANTENLTFEAKNISLVFDKKITVSAVHNMRPLSISLGYTPLEGVMSRNSCGDLDPGIVIYLMNVHKYSIYQIDQMLKHESGFFGMTGYDLGLPDLLKLRGKDRRVDLALDVCCAQIMKHIGQGIAVMGGLDNMIFGGGMVSSFIPLIYDIIKKMAFLGVNPGQLPWEQNAELIMLTSDESKINVYVNRKDLPSIIYYETELFLTNIRE